MVFDIMLLLYTIEAYPNGSCDEVGHSRFGLRLFAGSILGLGVEGQ